MKLLVGHGGRHLKIPLARVRPIASGGAFTFPIPPFMCGVGGLMGGEGWGAVLFTPLCEMAAVTRYGV